MSGHEPTATTLHHPAADPARAEPGRVGSAVLYPDAYAWFVLFASLDVMLTVLILLMGGYEMNTVADWVIGAFGLPGLVIYKFALVMVVVLVCEVIGRARRDLGRRVVTAAIVITLAPVAWSLYLIWIALPHAIAPHAP